MQEFWALLNFINPNVFQNLDEFIQLYGDDLKENIRDLHDTIRPHLLRRLKEDVETSMPPKEETVIEIELTTIQKQYYRALYEKDLKFLHRNKARALDGPALTNLTVQLRKCSNHAFLLTGVETELRAQNPDCDDLQSLVNTSGKLVLLDKLLPRLKQDGHRILLFSQFTRMLDIIQDYLNLRKFKYERIDGTITGRKRQAAIDRFQTSDKDQAFIMLLSTRAGGVGINLTAADTCVSLSLIACLFLLFLYLIVPSLYSSSLLQYQIIFDSDPNPQNDLQAHARCHRIGQTKPVKIYRLLTRKTYEASMILIKHSHFVHCVP